VIRRQAIVLLALVGLLVATYLWLYKIGAIGALQCGTGRCEYVQTSRYADLFGLPVALYGVVGYATLFVIGLFGLRPGRASDRRLPWLVAGLATAGVGFALYLTAIELFVLHAVCRWCVASALIITAIWLLSLLDLRPSP
jgi:uncharacterized membrane protein